MWKQRQAAEQIIPIWFPSKKNKIGGNQSNLRQQNKLKVSVYQKDYICLITRGSSSAGEICCQFLCNYPEGEKISQSGCQEIRFQLLLVLVHSLLSFQIVPNSASYYISSKQAGISLPATWYIHGASVFFLWYGFPSSLNQAESLKRRSLRQAL